MWLFPSENAGCNFIHDDCNSFSLTIYKEINNQEYNSKGKKLRIFFFEKRRFKKEKKKYCVNTIII